MATAASARNFTFVQEALRKRRRASPCLLSQATTDEERSHAEAVIKRLAQEFPVDQFNLLGISAAAQITGRALVEVAAHRVNAFGKTEVKVEEVKNMLKVVGANGDEAEQESWFLVWEFGDAATREAFQQWRDAHAAEKLVPKKERLHFFIRDLRVLPRNENFSKVAVIPTIQLVLPDPPTVEHGGSSPPSPPSGAVSGPGGAGAGAAGSEGAAGGPAGAGAGKKRKGGPGGAEGPAGGGRPDGGEGGGAAVGAGASKVQSAVGGGGGGVVKVSSKSKAGNKRVKMELPIHEDGMEEAPIPEGVGEIL